MVSTVGLMVCAIATKADNQGQQVQTNLVGSAADIWAGMHEQGMIDNEQYQHVLKTGHLPGGTVVSNSPISAEAQGNWNELAKEDVISPEELAAMLFDGDIPGLTEEEEQAFVDLAPVYQPKRSKRLTYEVRRKHAKVEMIRLAHHYRVDRKALEARALLLNIPLTCGEGALMSINEEGEPFYAASSGMGACDSISTDEVWGTNAVNAAGYVNTNFHLSGNGVTLAMWETGGVMEDHQEFIGRVEEHLQVPPGQDPYFHANTVGAILIGAGVTNGSHGMAPKASLHVYSYTDGHLPMLTEVANYGVISEASPSPTTNAVRFSNHSYRTHKDTVSAHGYYTPNDKKRDALVYSAYWHLPVWAVGNDRDAYEDYDSLNAGISKNVMGVGAIEKLAHGYTASSNVVLVSISGCGPTDDGRIKPDLVADGAAGGHIPDFDGGTDDYYYYNGYATSYAAPAVTGSLALLQELHERLNGTDSPLWASTYKGLAIHTADEAGNAPGPDYRFGWGVMNTLSAATLLAENAQWNSKPFIKEVVLPDGEFVCFPVQADTNQSLRVTICWSDPPVTNQVYETGPTIKTLVNDIDLRIIGSSGQTNYPWVLNPTNGYRANPAVMGDNTVDNVEQVEVTNTVAETYTVLINHKDVLLNDDGDIDGQELSIILSGVIAEDIDPSVVYSISTNGIPRLDFTNAIGSVYEVARLDDLVNSTWTDVPESPLSILRPAEEWSDAGISTNTTQFYKYKQVR